MLGQVGQVVDLLVAAAFIGFHIGLRHGLGGLLHFNRGMGGNVGVALGSRVVGPGLLQQRCRLGGRAAACHEGGNGQNDRG